MLSRSFVVLPPLVPGRSAQGFTSDLR